MGFLDERRELLPVDAAQLPGEFIADDHPSPHSIRLFLSDDSFPNARRKFLPETHEEFGSTLYWAVGATDLVKSTTKETLF